MNDHEELGRALDRVAEDRSPRVEASNLNDEDAAMLHMAQLVRGMAHPQPTREFIEQLHTRVFAGKRRVSRRLAFVSGIGTMAAGLLAGIGLDRAFFAGGGSSPKVSAGAGQWVAVAQVASVEEGAIHPFTAGPIKGFLIKREGRYSAVSRICTHMGCVLQAPPGRSALVCPCHGAQFALTGSLLSGPGGDYYRPLPPLPRIRVRIRGTSVEVWGA